MVRRWRKVAVVVMRVVAMGWLVGPVIAEGQTFVGTIAGPGSRWDDIALYEAGGKLFVDDVTGNRIIVYDAASRAYLTEISFSAYSPRYPMMLAMHQGTGTLYVALGTGSATNDTIIVPVDANTYATRPNLTNNGWDLFMVIDEARARLYLVGSKGLGDVLTAVDINTNTVAGTLNLYTVMGDGLMSFGREALNQVTGELIFANIHYDKFLLVNGPAMTGQLITATSSRGRAPAWNPAEHKLYITTVAWNGYFIYDPDTGSSSVTPCINDGTKIVYSQASNRMYTSGELSGWPQSYTTVMEGVTDACQNVTLPVGGLTGIGFVNARRHGYFAGTSGTYVLDEDTLSVVSSFPGSGGYGAVGSSVLVDQTHGRVFVLNSWSSPSQNSSIDVIVDQPLPTASINDMAVTEGQGGTRTANFTVLLSKASEGTVTVDYQTANGTATASVAGETIVPNTANITIPSSGAATPYPSTISVPSGLGSVQKVTATLKGLSHTWPSDVDVLLVGPGGQGVVLMSDAGSSTDATDLTFVFDDTGPALGTGTLASGTYRPTNISTGDSWPGPAPAGPYGTALSVFNGTDPAGVWTLYVVDDTSGDSGSFAAGWSLTITTPPQAGDLSSANGTLSIPPGATSGFVTVTVNGDTAVEPDETFFVNLSNASGATISDGQGIGTIVNDDGLSVRSDFTGDLRGDILWRHAIDGELWLWPMDGAARTAESYVRRVSDTDWEIRGLGDQTGDGKADILWRHKTLGMIYLWPMDGCTPLAETYVASVDPAYDIVGTGDFNGDGTSDILWRHTTNGEVWIWLMNGATPLGQVYVDTVDPAYVIKGVGDLDGDGKADIVWHHATVGEVWVWLMDGTTRLSATWVGTVADVGYQIVGTADHTGDGKADILWHHATTGEVWVWPMNGATRVAETWVGTVPDTNYRIVGTGDSNGDGKADILWHHCTTGEVWIWLMDGATRLSQTWVATVPDVGYQIAR
jgi:subtilisin-like proprotein convertase family protein